MNFTQSGSGKWEAMTRKNTGRYIAIVISDQVQSVPMVESAISGGNTQLAGNFTVEEADLLATLISSPYLPVDLSLQSASFRRVSASTGLPELLWPLIGFLVLGLAAYFVLNSLNINNKKT
jgi:preprotein translocase subunit SecD